MIVWQQNGKFLNGNFTPLVFKLNKIYFKIFKSNTNKRMVIGEEN